MSGAVLGGFHWFPETTQNSQTTETSKILINAHCTRCVSNKCMPLACLNSCLCLKHFQDQEAQRNVN